MNTSTSNAPLKSMIAAEKATRLPSFDEVMAELMLQLAIRDINRRTDARRQRQRQLRLVKDPM